MITLMVTAGLAEGVGVVTLVPVLELTESDPEAASGISRAIADVLTYLGLNPTLPVLLATIVAAMCGKSAALFLANQQVGYSVARVVRDLRVDLMRAVLGARWEYFTRSRPGAFANAVASEALRAAMAYREACSVIAALLQMLAYIIVAALISPIVALGTLAVAMILTAAGRHFFIRSREAGNQQTDGSRELSARLVDALHGIKPIKAMNREGLVWPLLEHEAAMLDRAQRKEVMAAAALKAFQEPVLAAALAIGLYLALEVSGQPLSSVLVLAFIFFRLVTHINTLQMRYQLMLVGESAFTALRRATEDAEAQREYAGHGASFSGLAANIVFDDVTFGYGDEPILRGMTMTIPAGEFVAVHGESGAGKTTLADLLVRLHEPDAGQIRVDEQLLTDLDLSAWRQSVGYVPQEVLLFNDSILMNVTLGDETLTREDAERALRMAGAWDFVKEREGRLDSMIGEQGSTLSGGQRRRIAIARALVSSPSLLILDEVTAALDPETEASLCETLVKLAGEVTIFSISHQTAMRDAAGVAYELRDGQMERLTPAVSR